MDSSFTCTPRFYHLTEWSIPAFAFPAEAGNHLPTPSGMEGWVGLGAELALRCMSFTLLPRCMECRRGLATRILSVCLSVRPPVKRVNCDKKEEKQFRFLYIR